MTKKEAITAALSEWCRCLEKIHGKGIDGIHHPDADRFRQVYNQLTKEKKSTAEKREYSIGVYLTETQYGQLCKKHGTDKTINAMKFLSDYKIRSGKTYKSDCLALQKWVYEAFERSKLIAPKRNISTIERSF